MAFVADHKLPIVFAEEQHVLLLLARGKQLFVDFILLRYGRTAVRREKRVSEIQGSMRTSPYALNRAFICATCFKYASARFR